MLENGASAEAVNTLGCTPFHTAASNGSVEVWKCLVEAAPGGNGSDTILYLENMKDRFGRSPIDTAEMYGFHVDPNDASLLVPKSKGNLKTSIVTSPVCMQHHTCIPNEAGQSSSPPENIRRLEVIINETSGSLCSVDLAPKLEWVRNSKAATISDVLRVHEWQVSRG